MELYYVLLLVTGGDPYYVGTFSNCEVAHAYVDENFIPDLRTICLHENFINLPNDFKHKYIHIDYKEPILYVQSQK